MVSVLPPLLRDLCREGLTFISSGIRISLVLLLLNCRTTHWIRFTVKVAPCSFRNRVHLSNT